MPEDERVLLGVVVDSQTRAVRDCALGLLQRRGWARLNRQEYGGRDNCRMGIVRALWAADEEINGWQAAHRRDSLGWKAIAEIEQELGIRNLYVWNSRPGRTEGQIFAALRGIPEASHVGEGVQ